jgi:hypothetical protein
VHIGGRAVPQIVKSDTRQADIGVAILVIQGKVVITALRHIDINLDAKVIALEVRKWDGEVIEIHILFIAEASFQAAGLILDQKV